MPWTMKWLIHTQTDAMCCVAREWKKTLRRKSVSMNLKLRTVAENQIYSFNLYRLLRFFCLALLCGRAKWERVREDDLYRWFFAASKRLMLKFVWQSQNARTLISNSFSVISCRCRCHCCCRCRPHRRSVVLMLFLLKKGIDLIFSF